MGQLGDTMGYLEAVTDPIFLPSPRYLILINLSWYAYLIQTRNYIKFMKLDMQT